MAERNRDDEEPIRDRTGEEEDEEYEEVDSEDEDDSDEDMDEDILDEEQAMPEDRDFTAEIGSEGGSRGDLQMARNKAGIARGSEATETGRPSPDSRHRERRPGGDW